jgi:hypothetical protein
MNAQDNTKGEINNMNGDFNYELNRAYRNQMVYAASQRQMASRLSQPAQTASHFYRMALTAVSAMVAIVLGLGLS